MIIYIFIRRRITYNRLKSMYSINLSISNAVRISKLQSTFFLIRKSIYMLRSQKCILAYKIWGKSSDDIQIPQRSGNTNSKIVYQNIHKNTYYVQYTLFNIILFVSLHKLEWISSRRVVEKYIYNAQFLLVWIWERCIEVGQGWSLVWEFYRSTQSQ